MVRSRPAHAPCNHTRLPGNSRWHNRRCVCMEPDASTLVPDFASHHCIAVYLVRWPIENEVGSHGQANQNEGNAGRNHFAGVHMRKLNAFNFVTLNGYLAGPMGDISWHRHGPEENEYASEALNSETVLLFGRVTYEMMANYWPTPIAIENDPTVANGMNRADKIVFSRTLKKAKWNNTRLVKDNIENEALQMKLTPGKDMTLLGSGSILTQFTEQGLIDEYQIMIDPVALGDGTTLFKNMKHTLNLKLTATRTFKSGVVLLSYEPVKQ
jgi:dihydrofolate reductase